MLVTIRSQDQEESLRRPIFNFGNFGNCFLVIAAVVKFSLFKT